MNREQKAAAVAEIAEQLKESEAIFAVDYRGISVPQAAALRTTLRDADATFRVVKNTLTERAADEAGTEQIKELLQGPTALTFVRGDVAAAAKALADYQRQTDLMAFKGGLLNGEPLDAEQIKSIARLPSRDVLYGQLVGVVASPITGLARTLNALLSGVAVALGGVLEKKEKGEIPAGDPPATAAAEETAAQAPAAEAEEAPAAEAEEAPAAEAAAEAPAEGATEEAAPASDEPGDQDAEPPAQPAAPEEPAEGAEDAGDTTDTDDTKADASADAE